MRHKTTFLLLTCIFLLACHAVAGEKSQPIVAGNLGDFSKLFTHAISTEGHVRERMAARRLLADLIETSRAHLHNKLADGASIERQVSASVLGETGDLRDEAILLQALQAGDPILYLHAATALKDIYSRMELPMQLARLDYYPDNPQEKLSTERYRKL